MFPYSVHAVILVTGSLISMLAIQSYVTLPYSVRAVFVLGGFVTQSYRFASRVHAVIVVAGFLVEGCYVSCM